MSNAIERVGVIGAGQMGGGIAEVCIKSGAQVLAFEPTDTEIEGLQQALREMKQPFLMSLVPPSEREMALAIASICGFLERRARELGATNIDPAEQGAAADRPRE